MRRRLSVAAFPAVASTVLAPRREIYSIWGTVCNDEKVVGGTSFWDRVMANSGQRSFALNTVPVNTKKVGRFSEPEQYLISAVEDDAKRIMSVDWTVEFDPFWRDRLRSHEQLFNTLYKPGSGVRKMLIGSATGGEESKNQAEAALNRLRSILKWAEECERRYSLIAQARFKMQREVFDPFEREKILASCVEVCDEYKAKVPAEFRRKACSDLEWHLGNMRHWIWDCPNAKQHFPRQLA